ncbi:hypothetical protein [Umezawaea sp.]|uniref:hypothetical protein n=1 Tax=Umezawaea sp. TaxID=1955258 RepID=UPI002ED64DC3
MPTPAAELPDLLWPQALVRPTAPPKLVYLDLNHWIYLSQAASGSVNGERYRPALDACRHARAAGTAVFVLAGVHYMEMTKIKDPAQRGRLTEVMEELSGFVTLLDRQIVIRLEIESVLDDRLGPWVEPYPTATLLGRGFGHAFGMKGGFTLRHKANGRDASDLARARLGKAVFDDLMMKADLFAERGMLRDPADVDLPQLKEFGYREVEALKVNRRRAEQENEQHQRHHGTKWGAGQKLGDVVMAREAIVELIGPLLEGLLRRGIDDIKVLFADKAAARDVVRAMPVSYVSALLKTEQHRNASKVWSPNDIFDIDGMSLAVPYCEIVVTEKHRWHDLHIAKVESRTDTVILRSLSELPGHLNI